MKYVVALSVAGALIAAVSLWANETSKSLETRFRQRLIESQRAGHIPADIDLKTADLTDFGAEVSESEMLQVQLIDFWFRLRLFLIPAVIAGTLLVTYFLPATSGHNSIEVKRR